MRVNDLPPRLQEGEEVRLVQDGPWCRVIRVTFCAAYLAVITEPKLVVIPETVKMVRTPEGTKEVVTPERQFYSHTADPMPGISAHAFVYERREALA